MMEKCVRPHNYACVTTFTATENQKAVCEKRMPSIYLPQVNVNSINTIDRMHLSIVIFFGFWCEYSALITVYLKLPQIHCAGWYASAAPLNQRNPKNSAPPTNNHFNLFAWTDVYARARYIWTFM